MEPLETFRGFILQSTYRVEAGLPIIYLSGRLETGETFLVRDRREVPYFYIRRADEHAAEREGARLVDAAGRVDFAGEPVLRVEVRLPQDVPPLRDRLQAAGIVCYEADVQFPMRYLIDRGIRSAITIIGTGTGTGTGASPDPGNSTGAGTSMSTGAARRGDRFARIFDDPEITRADFSPRLSVLSLDIETDPQEDRLLSIALWGCGAQEVLLFTPKGLSCPAGAIPFDNERDLIAAFCQRVRDLDPDVLTGWSVIDFDLTVLARLAQRFHVPFELGRFPGALRIQEGRSPRNASRAFVPGRLVLDGLQLLRGALIPMEEYSLDFVSRKVLGEGKTLHGKDRLKDILRLFANDRPSFVEYNLTDARLVMEILDKLQLIELSVERSRLTGLPPDRLSSNVAAFDFMYLSALHQRGVVVATQARQEEFEGPITGGHVLDPRPGLYENVLTFDFKSLYPSLIRTFQIDPLGYVPLDAAPRPDLGPETEPETEPEPEPEPSIDLIQAPSGAAFRREPGILPSLLDDLFPSREAAKAQGDKVKSHAIKILMNSFYGALGTPQSRLHSPALANAVTSFGKEILLFTKDLVEARGYAVIYGDTDSLFVLSGEPDPAQARALGARLVQQLNHDLAAHIQKTWRVTSRLELQFETLYMRLLLPRLRQGTEGARKRYAGLIEEHGERRVHFTGLEVVRRDWTPLAKRVQRELYERLFSDREVDSYLRQVVADLRGGLLDGDLLYKKGLNKDLDAYTGPTPPHVAAARKLSGPAGWSISYLITKAGPEPAEQRKSPIDYEHYLDKQLRPIAEPLLALLHLDFDKVIGDNRQLELF